jgi:hypothetical protein
MKRCPECGRDYNDDSLSFCLDDGSELLFGPSSAAEPTTAILASADIPSEAPTRLSLEENDQAFRWIEKALNRREGALPGIVDDQFFKFIRDDPRYGSVLARMGLR